MATSSQATSLKVCGPVEQHQVHLGSALRFGCQLDAMLIDAAWLDRPWPRGSSVATSLACGQAQAAAEAEPARAPALPAALYDYLLERVRTVPTLERTAADFGVRPATLKRQLLRHHTHFQAELDQVRTHVALWLFQAHRADNDTVARYLGFHDAANFRRSFKRWTASARRRCGRHSMARWRWRDSQAAVRKRSR